MQQSQHVEYNHALEYAIERANEIDRPLVGAFGLMDDYPEANPRHYAFMLEGLRETQSVLKKRGVQMVVVRRHPADVALFLGKNASLIVCDRGYLKHQKEWRYHVADEARCHVVQIESDVVIPVETVSSKAEFAARTIRPKIHRRLNDFLVELKPRRLKRRLRVVEPRSVDLRTSSAR